MPKQPVKHRPEPLDSLTPPNHMVPLTSHPTFSPYPLLTLRHKLGDRDKYLFVDESYGPDTWPCSKEHPPSWMDPEVFAKMAQADSEISELIEDCIARQTRAPIKRMLPMLQRVFEEAYLPMMLELFDDSRKAVLAEWLVAHRQDLETEAEELNEPKRKRKPASATA